MRLLECKSRLSVKYFRKEFLKLYALKEYFSFSWLMEASQQLYDSAFARAGASYNAQSLPSFKSKAYISQRRGSAARIIKRYVFKADYGRGRE